MHSRRREIKWSIVYYVELNLKSHLCCKKEHYIGRDGGEGLVAGCCVDDDSWRDGGASRFLIWGASIGDECCVLSGGSCVTRELVEVLHRWIAFWTLSTHQNFGSRKCFNLSSRGNKKWWRSQGYTWPWSFWNRVLVVMLSAAYVFGESSASEAW